MRITQLRPRKPMRRPCKVCDEMFHPTGKFSRLCEDCMNNAYALSIKRRRLTIKKKMRERKK